MIKSAPERSGHSFHSSSSTDGFHLGPAQPYLGSRRIWDHLLGKHVFDEERCFAGPREPLRYTLDEDEDEHLTPVTKIEIYRGGEGEGQTETGSEFGVIALAFHGAGKLFQSEEQMRRVEGQVVVYCRDYLAKSQNADIGSLYVVTTFGTRGKVWTYIRDMDSLGPWSDDVDVQQGYMEMDSSEALELSAAFEAMKFSI